MKPKRPSLNRTVRVAERLLNPVPVQPNLLSVGNNFYATPPTPQEPNYGDPFSDSPIGIDIEIVSDGCNFGIQLTGSLAFIKLPSFQFVWRNPACTPRKDPFDLPEIQTTPSTTDLYWKFKFFPYQTFCREEVPFFYPTLIIGGFGYNFRGKDTGSESKVTIFVEIISVVGRVVREFIPGLGFFDSWTGEVVYRIKKTDFYATYTYDGLDFDIFGVGNIYSKKHEHIIRNETREGVFRAFYSNNTWQTESEFISGDDAEDLKREPYFTWNHVNRNPLEKDFTPTNEKRRFYQKIFFNAQDFGPGWTPELAINYANKFKYIVGGKMAYDLPYGLVTTASSGYTYIYVSDGSIDVTASSTSWNTTFNCNTPTPLAPLPPMRKDCCYETKQVMYATQANLLARIQELEIKNAQLERDNLAIENYINQLDQAGRQAIAGIARFPRILKLIWFLWRK